MAVAAHAQSLLSDPNPNSPANSEAARLYSENRWKCLVTCPACASHKSFAFAVPDGLRWSASLCNSTCKKRCWPFLPLHDWEVQPSFVVLGPAGKSTTGG